MAWGRGTAEETLAKLTAQMARFGSDAQLAATKKLAGLVRLQATVMSIADVFMALTVLFLLDCAARAADAEARPRRWRGRALAWRPAIA